MTPPLAFKIEQATPEECARTSRGRMRSELYQQLDALKAGEVLRVRGAVTYGRAWSCIAQIKSRKPGSKFATRKTNNGLDLYRLA